MLRTRSVIAFGTTEEIAVMNIHSKSSLIEIEPVDGLVYI
jgi:hypothetical protein